MKTIYIDSEFRCYTSNDGTMTAVTTDAFDGKCDAYIKGYRFIPAGASWTRHDGVVFRGEMVTPFKDYQLLETVQILYEETNVIVEEVSALRAENEMLTECVLELSEIVYA